MTGRAGTTLRTTGASIALVAAVACADEGPSGPLGVTDNALCDLPQSLLASGAVPEAIPALTEPNLVRAVEATYLLDDDRVLGVVVDGEARAYPHNILWSHEVVNDRFDDRWITVTFCPLTGSGLAFDATVQGRRVEFGVSGLLFANNLVLYDRITEDLFGPQLSAQGHCQRFAGAVPDLVGVQEMSWGRWKDLHPGTRVLSDATGHSRNYRWYPYGGYDDLGNDDLLYPMEPDRSRPLKERVLGIRTGPGTGRGYPFGELSRVGSRVALNEVVAGTSAAIFFESGSGGAAVAYERQVSGRVLTFEVHGDHWRDTETDTHWTLGGRAFEGPLSGEVLQPLPEAYVVFWFAWRHFQPDAEIWLAP